MPAASAFSRLISVGNEVDLAVGEIADLMVDDPRTNAILLFMETLRDGERLARAARRAHAAGKPVIAYKLGRSEIGQELAKSHTGAIAGSDATFDAFCRRHGIARVSMFESLVDVPALLVDRPAARGQAGRRRHHDRRRRGHGGRQHGDGRPRHRRSAAGAGRLAETARHRGGRGQAGRSHPGRRQARDRGAAPSSGCWPTTATMRRSSSSAPRRSSIPSWPSSRC